MQEYQISLEDKVRNAFIRRKAKYIEKAVTSEEYKLAARSAKQALAGMIASAGSQYGNNSYSVNDISDGLKAIEETLSGDIELQATKWAFGIYSVPGQLSMFNKGLKDEFQMYDLDAKKLDSFFEKYLSAIGHNEALIHYIIGSVQHKGDTQLERISEAVKEFYPEKSKFIAKEKEFADSYDSYMLAARELNECISAPENMYASMVTGILQSLLSCVYKKAAEIEADELFSM